MASKMLADRRLKTVFLLVVGGVVLMVIARAAMPVLPVLSAIATVAATIAVFLAPMIFSEDSHLLEPRTPRDQAEMDLHPPTKGGDTA